MNPAPPVNSAFIRGYLSSPRFVREGLLGEHFVSGGNDHVDLDAIHAIRYVAPAALRRQPHLTTRTARQVDAHHPMTRAERAVPHRLRRAEERNHWCANHRSEVHRSCVAGDEQVEAGQQCREINDAQRSARVDRLHARQPPATSSTSRRSVESPVSTIVA